MLSLSSRKNDWTDKETHAKTLGPPRNYCEEHYCEEHGKSSSVLPKKGCKAQDGQDSSSATEGL